MQWKHRDIKIEISYILIKNEVFELCVNYAESVCSKT